MTQNEVGIGVIGTGWWSTQFHIPAVIANPSARLVGVADKDPERLRACREAFDLDLAVDSHLELLSNPDIAAVVIATPHSSHFTLAKDALMAGKHVLVEKPLTLDADQARELRDTGLLEGTWR